MMLNRVIGRMLLILLLLVLAGPGKAQDTLRYRHTFNLPVAANQNGYERSISQYPSNLHSFIFDVPDSCTVFIVFRSAYDSLDIRMEDVIIDLSSQKDGLYEYGFAGPLTTGNHIITVRTRQYASWKVYIKGMINAK